MEILYFKNQEELPMILFEKEDHNYCSLKIKGHCESDGNYAFNESINWVKNYINNPSENTHLHLSLDSLNISIYETIIRIIKLLENISITHKVFITWEYSDEDYEELGNDFSQLTKIPFEFNYIPSQPEEALLS